MNEALTFGTVLAFAGKIFLKLVLSVGIAIVGVIVIKYIQKLIESVSKKRFVDTTLMQFIKSFVKIVLYILLIYIVADTLGFNMTSFIALLGSAALAIGLSLQGSLANVAGGLLILLNRPFKVGDYIISSLAEGTVKQITILYTRLESVDKKVITVPNGALSAASITNCSAGENRRVDISIGIAYEADLKKAKELILACYNECEDIIKDPAPSVHVAELGESAVILGAAGFTESAKYWDTKWQLTEDIKLALDSAGIEIAYNKIDVKLINK